MNSFDRLAKILSDILDVPPETITESSRLVGDLGADSLSRIEIVLALEETFPFRRDAAANFAGREITVGEIVAWIESVAD